MIDPERKIQALINRLNDERKLHIKWLSDMHKTDYLTSSDRHYRRGVIEGIELSIMRIELLQTKVTDDSDRKE